LPVPSETLATQPDQAEWTHDPTAFVLGASRTIEASINTHQRLLGDETTVRLIAHVAEVLVNAFRRGQKLLLFGNGGSAADAQHMAAEFVGRFVLERAALPASALSVNTSCVTAIGNDYGFDHVFARQIEAFGKPGDEAVGISTSGNSANVLLGLAKAREMGMTAVALAGASGGTMKNAADYCICVPSEETPRIQECHTLIGHVIAELVERAMVHGSSRIS
jgi:D-sedoheptulose 7-phosphate isomerase